MKKKLFAIGLAVLMSIGILVGCKTENKKIDKEADSKNPAVAASSGTVGFSISTLNNPFFVSMADSAKKTAKELGVELAIVDAGNDSAKQTSDIEDLMSKGIKVLLVNPEDSAAIAPVIKEAQEKGIKVIAIDRSVEGVNVDTYIGTDNVVAGETAGKKFLEKVGEGSDVVILQGILGASSAIDRHAGFLKALEGKVNIVADPTANYDRTEGLNVTEDVLQAHPNIKGIIAANDEMALGAIEAIKAAGKTPGQDILVGGFDANEDAKEAVNSGEMLYTVEQQTVEMGKNAVECAVDYMQGKEVPNNIPIEIVLIEK